MAEAPAPRIPEVPRVPPHCLLNIPLRLLQRLAGGNAARQIRYVGRPIVLIMLEDDSVALTHCLISTPAASADSSTGVPVRLRRAVSFNRYRYSPTPSTPLKTPPAESPPAPLVSSSSFLPSASPAASACAKCRRRSIWRARSF